MAAVIEPPKPTPEQIKAQKRKYKGKVRAFRWDTIKHDEASKSPFWKGIDDQSFVEEQLDIDGLRAAFANKSKKKKKVAKKNGAGKTGAGRRQRSQSRAKAMPKIIEPSRANRLDISVGSLEKQDVTGADLRQAIMSIDDDIATGDLIDRMVNEKIYPEGKECDALLKHRKQLEQGLGTKAEQFFCHLADLPRLVPRLRCMQFRCAYDAEEQALSVKVSILHEVAKQLSSSMAKGGKLRRLFTIILGVGNSINGSDAKLGGAFAFELSTLLKLAEAKTTQVKPQISLLKWIVCFIRDKLQEPELLSLNQEMSRLSEVKKIELLDLEQRIQILRNRCNQCDREAKIEERADDDRFNEVMGAFVKRTKASIQNLVNAREAMLETLDQVYSSLCSESLAKATKDQLKNFWVTLESFLTQIDHVRRKLEFEELAQEKKQKRLEAQMRTKMKRQERIAKQKNAKANPAESAAASLKPNQRIQRNISSRRTKRKTKRRVAMHDLMEKASMASPTAVIEGYERAHKRAARRTVKRR